eukprot:Gb_22531 [translate_table: standard]
MLSFDAKTETGTINETEINMELVVDIDIDVDDEVDVEANVVTDISRPIVAKERESSGGCRGMGKVLRDSLVEEEFGIGLAPLSSNCFVRTLLSLHTIAANCRIRAHCTCSNFVTSPHFASSGVSSETLISEKGLHNNQWKLVGQFLTVANFLLVKLPVSSACNNYSTWRQSCYTAAECNGQFWGCPSVGVISTIYVDFLFAKRVICMLDNLPNSVDISAETVSDLIGWPNEGDTVDMSSKLPQMEAAKLMCHSTEASSLNGILVKQVKDPVLQWVMWFLALDVFLFQKKIYFSPSMVTTLASLQKGCCSNGLISSQTSGVKCRISNQLTMEYVLRLTITILMFGNICKLITAAALEDILMAAMGSFMRQSTKTMSSVMLASVDDQPSGCTTPPCYLLAIPEDLEVVAQLSGWILEADHTFPERYAASIKLLEWTDIGCFSSNSSSFSWKLMDCLDNEDDNKRFRILFSLTDSGLLFRLQLIEEACRTNHLLHYSTGLSERTLTNSSPLFILPPPEVITSWGQKADTYETLLIVSCGQCCSYLCICSCPAEFLAACQIRTCTISLCWRMMKVTTRFCNSVEKCALGLEVGSPCSCQLLHEATWASLIGCSNMLRGTEFTIYKMDEELSELYLGSRAAIILVPYQSATDPSDWHLSSQGNSKVVPSSLHNMEAGPGFLGRILSYLNPFSYFGGRSSNQESMSRESLRQYGANPSLQNAFRDGDKSSIYTSKSNTPMRGQKVGSSGSSSKVENKGWGSNIHTLKHDEDESFRDRNAFWNGNSTQFGGDDSKRD